MKVALLILGILFVLQSRTLAATTNPGMGGGAVLPANPAASGNTATHPNLNSGVTTNGAAGNPSTGSIIPGNSANVGGGGGAVSPGYGAQAPQNPNTRSNPFPNSTPSTAATPNLSPDTSSQ